MDGCQSLSRIPQRRKRCGDGEKEKHPGARQRVGLDKLAQPPEKQPEREEQEKHLSLAYGSPPPRPVRTCRSGQG